MKPIVKAGKVAPMSVAAAEAAELQRTMQSNTIPSFIVNMDTACKKCGTMGATVSGFCLPCITKQATRPATRRAQKNEGKQKRVGQGELSGMPEPSGPGRVAREYLDVLEVIDQKTTEKGDLMQSLINSLKKAKRTSVQIDGYYFTLKHVGPKDSILVQKPKS